MASLNQNYLIVFAPGSSVSVGGNRTSTLPCSRDLLSIRGNPSLLCSRDCVRIPGNLLCSRDLARIPGNPSTHAALFPAFVREFLGIVYARLSVFYSQDCGEFPGICRSRDWMYRTDENQRIPGNLNENYQELWIPKTEL